MQSSDPITFNVRKTLRLKRYRGHWKQEDHHTVIEEPFTLFVNGHEFVTFLATPTSIDELVLGFLASEGLIQRRDQLTVFVFDDEEHTIWVRIPGLDPSSLNQFGKRYLSTCCGRGRPGLYLAQDTKLVHAMPILHIPSLSVNVIPELFDQLNRWSSHERSGGLHVGALAYADHGLIQIRADVGRHNVLDKLFGWALSHPEPDQEQRLLVFSGRLSAEVVVKANKMNIPVILSNAAPTTLGLELADALGITAVGFIRSQEFSIFSHPERFPDIPQIR